MLIYAQTALIMRLEAPRGKRTRKSRPGMIMACFCGVREGASDENHDPACFWAIEPDPTQIHCGGVCSLSALSLVS